MSDKPQTHSQGETLWQWIECCDMAAEPCHDCGVIGLGLDVWGADDSDLEVVCLACARARHARGCGCDAPGWYVPVMRSSTDYFDDMFDPTIQTARTLSKEELAEWISRMPEGKVIIMGGAWNTYDDGSKLADRFGWADVMASAKAEPGKD